MNNLIEIQTKEIFNLPTENSLLNVITANVVKKRSPVPYLYNSMYANHQLLPTKSKYTTHITDDVKP